MRTTLLGFLPLVLLASCSNPDEASPTSNTGTDSTATSSGQGGAGGGPTDAGTDPTPIPTECMPDPAMGQDEGVRVKSPASQMRFTEGLPFRILADASDPNAWMCPPGHPPYVCPGWEMRFYVDGTLAGAVPPNVNEENHWELRLPGGLAKGDHTLTVSFVTWDPQTNGAGPVVDGKIPVRISVDGPPSHAGTVTLTQDLVLNGSTDLNWQDQTVVGNGHKVTAAPGYSGRILIKNSSVSGLADYDLFGIEVTTTGEVSIEDSVFEATAPIRLNVDGTAPVTIKNNEFRSSNFVTYVASDPERSPVLHLSGSTTGAKTMQGNRFGGGIVRFENSGKWQVGGLAAGEGNILIGPRAVLEFVSSSDNIIQGNYDLHDYHGGWSQGFNLLFQNGSDRALAEHNVFRSSSWPVQTFGGEFRYNLVVDSGHDWWRSARDNTKIHHNVFVHTTGPDGSFNGGIMVYGNETGVDIFNNTFDGGGDTGKFAASAIAINSDSALFASIRNNVFTGFSEVGSSFGDAFVSGNAGAPRVQYADYNAFFNPLAPNTSAYSAGLVQASPGAHDVQSDPQFAGTPEIPYQISAGCVWSRTYTTAQVLTHYRELYQPAAGSPLIDTGDTADGAGTDIGAIGAGMADPKDLFGRGIQ